MSIRITEDQMTCEATGHTARRGEAGWQVSWLPGRILTRNQATTAMVLGEAAAQDPQPGDRIWPFAEGWAAELGLPHADEAIRMARGNETTERADLPRSAREIAATEPDEVLRANLNDIAEHDAIAADAEQSFADFWGGTGPDYEALASRGQDEEPWPDTPWWDREKPHSGEPEMEAGD